ncbi:MAG: glycosyl transferase family protein [Halioglobus sp.]
MTLKKAPMTPYDSDNPMDTEHPFAQYVRILGKGKSGTRSLTQDEAIAAFSMILNGEAEDMQVGAFLMLLRVKEETGEELAGFVLACRDNMLTRSTPLSADLDWSSYAGKKHQHPWFILSILLLTQAGYRVFIHGTDGHTQGRLYTEQALSQLQLPVADSWAQVSTQLDEQGLSYLPLRRLCPPLDALIQLRPLLGLRSPVHTLTRMLNPLSAPASIQSIFHPAYGILHQEADKLLGQPRAVVFKGDSGEVEIKPQADTRILSLLDGDTSEMVLKRSLGERVASVGEPSVEPLRALWRGEEDDPYGLDAVLATTAVALSLLDPGLSLPDAQNRARSLWQQREFDRLLPCR